MFDFPPGSLDCSLLSWGRTSLRLQTFLGFFPKTLTGTCGRLEEARLMEKDRTQAGFPKTRWEIVLAARGKNTAADQALAELCESYWMPLYAFARRSGRSPSDAEDLAKRELYHTCRRNKLPETNSTPVRTYTAWAYCFANC